MKEYGIRRKRSAQDVLSKTKEMLDEASKVTEAAESSSKSEIEKLQFENNNYKSSLEAAQSMFDDSGKPWMRTRRKPSEPPFSPSIP